MRHPRRFVLSGCLTALIVSSIPCPLVHYHRLLVLVLLLEVNTVLHIGDDNIICSSWLGRPKFGKKIMRCWRWCIFMSLYFYCFHLNLIFCIDLLTVTPVQKVDKHIFRWYQSWFYISQYNIKRHMSRSTSLSLLNYLFKR